MIGTGYVGLVSGVCFADLGNDVVCVDKDIFKINKLKKGIIPIYEPGLSELVKKNYKSGRLSFTTNLSEAIKDVETNEKKRPKKNKLKIKNSKILSIFFTRKFIFYHLLKHGYCTLFNWFILHSKLFNTF